MKAAPSDVELLRTSTSNLIILLRSRLEKTKLVCDQLRRLAAVGRWRISVFRKCSHEQMIHPMSILRDPCPSNDYLRQPSSRLIGWRVRHQQLVVQLKPRSGLTQLPHSFAESFFGKRELCHHQRVKTSSGQAREPIAGIDVRVGSLAFWGISAVPVIVVLALPVLVLEDGGLHISNAVATNGLIRDWWPALLEWRPPFFPT